jgi:hypothetical protein
VDRPNIEGSSGLRFAVRAMPRLPERGGEVRQDVGRLRTITSMVPGLSTMRVVIASPARGPTATSG